MKVHSIESLAALDGDGLRYAIYLCGCPLKCTYCHNPDMLDINAGTDQTPQELFSKIIRYVPYFRAGGGGVTFSGGEPLIWADELDVLGKMLNFAGINYTIDTSACLPLTGAVRNVLRNADLVICDLKAPREDAFRQMTGGELMLVRDFYEFLESEGIRTRIRTVIVPGVNDTMAALEDYIDFYLKNCPSADGYELIAFHTMGFFKYDRLQRINPLADTPPLDIRVLTELQEYVNRRIGQNHDRFRTEL